MFWQFFFFFIFHKNDVKTFLKWIINQYHKDIRYHFPILISSNIPFFFLFSFLFSLEDWDYSPAG